MYDSWGWGWVVYFIVQGGVLREVQVSGPEVQRLAPRRSFGRGHVGGYALFYLVGDLVEEGYALRVEVGQVRRE